MKKIQHLFKVVSNKPVSRRFFRLALDAPVLAPGGKIRSGQFVHIRITDTFQPFFRRPFSVFRCQSALEILYEVIGKGTTLLSQKKKGDRLDVLGPLGNSFQLPDKNIKQVVMIAGGMGIAPFMILSDALKKMKAEKILLYGARTGESVFPLKEFKQNGCQVYVTTEDGSMGQKGRVPVLYSKINPDPRTTMIYTCGPRPMIADVQQFALKHQLKGQASCEEVMACGLGACLGCVIKTIGGYKTVCNDGPVFELKEIVF